MSVRDSMSSPLEIAPVIFPKPAAKDPEDGTTRSIHVFESLRRHRLVSGLTLLFCLLCSGLLIYKRRGPTYEASSRVYISPVASKALTEDRQQEAPYEGFVDQQMKTVTRYDVVKAALGSLPQPVWAGYGPTEEIAISILDKVILVAREGQSFEITISLEGSNAQDITSIVNAVTNAYIEKASNITFLDRDQKLATLHGEQSRLQTQLSDKETQQTRLLQALGIASIGTDSTSPYNDQLAKLHSDLNDANEALAQSQSKLQALRTNGVDGPGMKVAADDIVASDPGYNVLKQNLSAEKGKLTQEMAMLTPSNPLYKQDSDQLDEIEKQLTQNADKLQKTARQQITQRYESDINQKRIVVNQLREQLLEQTHQATGSAPQYQQAQQVSADIDHLQTGLAAVEQRIRELEVDSSSPGSVYLSSAAMVPLAPVKSKMPAVILILLIFSIVASVIVAVAIDFFDPHLYNADDVKQVMGFAPLGVLLDHDHFSAEVSQQYLLRLAAGIHHAVRASGARTFLFTATEPECGTTTVVEKLARQLRVLNLRTLTVAATNVDGKISYVNTAAPIAPAPSYDAKRGPAGADSDKLRTQPIGPLALSSHVGEPAQSMFSGSFVAQVLAENENNYDVVLVDGGPLLISADTEYLARVADGTIIVAQSGRTTRKQLERSATLLERLHVPGVAVALNRVNPNHADAALRQDVLDFQQQLKKQRGTALSKQYTRRIPQERQPGPENPNGATAGETEESYKRVSVL